MKNSINLGRIGGIEIGIHYSWLLAFILITWVLAGGFFPEFYEGWAQYVYWLTGAVAALLLFGSVLIHELAHSFVARARGMSVNSITLFVFGGVSNLEEEPEQPRVEFAMAIVGPMASLLLAGVFWGFSLLVPDQQSPLAALLGYLAWLNALLAGFNLLPGFPLDGGRVLRSIIWGSTGNLTRATNIVATIGQLLGWAAIGYGVFQLLSGNLIGGLWIAFIGWFLSNAADAGRRQVSVRENLRGVRVRDVMDGDLEHIGPDATVEDLVQRVFLKDRLRAVPVMRDDHLIGIVTLTDAKRLPQEKWAETHVEDLMTKEPLHRIGPDDDLNSALQLMGQHDLNQLLVMKEGRLVGMISRADIIRYLQVVDDLGVKAPGPRLDRTRQETS